MIAPIDYPGAKWSFADWIVSYIPEHSFYIEPYFGSGAVFFKKNPSRYETINDLDGLVVNFFRACRDYPEELASAIELTPYSRQEFLSIQEELSGQEMNLTGNCVEDARRFCIRCTQGYGSKLSERVGWKNTKHSAGPFLPNTWSKLPQTILEAAQRLKHAQIECTDAVELIKACNASDCLIYADPPYLGEVRKNSRIYRKELLEKEQHIKLLEALLWHKGPVMLSGYDNHLYNEKLEGWTKVQKQGRANSTKKRIETLWMNYNYQMTFPIG